MDILTDYNRRAAAEDVFEYELRDQATGEVIMSKGKPAIVLVRSSQSDAVLSADRSEKNKALIAAFKKSREKQSDEDRSDGLRFDWGEVEEATNKRAIVFIAGFKNLYTETEGGKMRKLTEADAEAFVSLDRISEEHHWRSIIPLSKNDDESDDEFAARKAEIEGRWLGASFAQQIIDAESEHTAALGKPAKT